MKYKQQINFNYNPDIDKGDVTEKTNIKDKIVSFLSKMNEVSASRFIEMELFNDSKKISSNTDKGLLEETKKISSYDKRILQEIIQIRKDLIDEQDTSVKGARKKEGGEQNKQTNNLPFASQASGININLPDFDIDNPFNRGIRPSADVDRKNKAAKLREERRKAAQRKKEALNKKRSGKSKWYNKFGLGSGAAANPIEEMAENVDKADKPDKPDKAKNKANNFNKIESDNLSKAKKTSIFGNTGKFLMNGLSKAVIPLTAGYALYEAASDEDAKSKWENENYLSSIMQAANSGIDTMDLTSLFTDDGKGLVSTFLQKNVIDKYDEKNGYADAKRQDSFENAVKDIENRKDNVKVVSVLDALDKKDKIDGKLLSKNREKEQELENKGILTRSLSGKSSISNWSKANKLSTSDLILLSMNASLSGEDKAKLGDLIMYREKNKIVIPENSLDIDLSKPVIFKDSDLIAYSVLNTKTDLDKFIAEHPFTDDNIIKVDKEEDGKKWTEVQYKDDALNTDYIKLKEQYDKEYKKYSDLRKKQIRSLGDFREIEGEILTAKEFQDFTTNSSSYGGNVKNFTEGLRNSEASKTVEDLILKFKNIQLPLENITLAERIKGAEGLRLQAYPDAGGYSIGYGHFIKPNEMNALAGGITKEQAEALFNSDFIEHKKAAESIDGYNDAPKEVKDALIDMTYNMGAGWIKKWPIFAENLRNKNYSANGDIIRHSLYATQVQGRAFQNAKRFDIGENKKNGKENQSVPKNNTSVYSISGSSTVPVDETSNKADNINNIKTLTNDDAINSKDRNVLSVENQTNNLVSKEQIIATQNYINGISSSSNSQNITNNPVKEEETSLNGAFIL